MPRGGFHIAPRELACKACGQTFVSDKPGRQAWYCHRPECDNQRRERRLAQMRDEKRWVREGRFRRAWVKRSVERAEQKARLGLSPRQVLALATKQLATATTADEAREAARAVAGAAFALAFWVDDGDEERLAA